MGKLGGGTQQQAKQHSAVTTETVVKKTERYIQQEIGFYIYNTSLHMVHSD
jgi:hypothetical protein